MSIILITGNRLVPRLLVLTLVTLVTVGACADDPESSGGDRVEVVVGFYPLAEAARRVGGDLVDVEDLTPAGSEPHALELEPRQVADVGEADVVLVMGQDFQPAVEDAARSRQGGTLEVLDALGIDGGEGIEDGEGLDPHVWLDPRMMAEIVDEVSATLAEADRPNRAVYADNAGTYRAELLALDQRFEQGLASCPRREIVVSHEAFGWLARRYELEQHGITGLSPDQEPDPRRLAELAELVADEGVTTVFTEALVAADVAQALAREAGVVTAVLEPIEVLTDEQRAEGESYASLMEANLAALEEALGC